MLGESETYYRVSNVLGIFADPHSYGIYTLGMQAYNSDWDVIIDQVKVGSSAVSAGNCLDGGQAYGIMMKNILD